MNHADYQAALATGKVIEAQKERGDYVVKVLAYRAAQYTTSRTPAGPVRHKVTDGHTYAVLVDDYTAFLSTIEAANAA